MAQSAITKRSLPLFFGWFLFAFSFLSLQAQENIPVEQGWDKIRNELQIAQTGHCALVLAPRPGSEDVLLLAYLRRSGYETHVCFATRGENSDSGLDPDNEAKRAAKNSLKAEKVAAMVGAEVWFLNLPDAGAERIPVAIDKWWDPTKSSERLTRIVRTIQPDVLIVSAPFEVLDKTSSDVLLKLSQQVYGDAVDKEKFPEQLKEGLKPWPITQLWMSGPVQKSNWFKAPGRDPLTGFSSHYLLSSVDQYYERSHEASLAQTNISAEKAVVSRLKQDEIPSPNEIAPKGALPEFPAEFDEPPTEKEKESQVFPPKISWVLHTPFGNRYPAARILYARAAAVHANALNEGAPKEYQDLYGELAVTIHAAHVARRIRHLDYAAAEALGLNLQISTQDPLISTGDSTQLTGLTAPINGGWNIELSKLEWAAEPGWQLPDLQEFAKQPLKSYAINELLTKGPLNITANDAFPNSPIDRKYLRRQDRKPVSLKASFTVDADGKFKTEIQLPPTQLPLDLAPDYEAHIETLGDQPVLLLGDPDQLAATLIDCRCRLIVRNNKSTPWTLYARLKEDPRLKAQSSTRVAVFDFTERGQEHSFEFNAMADVELLDKGDLELPLELWTKAFRFSNPPIAKFRRVPVRISTPLVVGLIGTSETSTSLALQQMSEQTPGLTYTFLTPDKSRDADFEKFHTLIIDQDALNQREDVRLESARLLEFMKAGGHVVCLSQSKYADKILPYPITFGAESVSDEESAVQIVLPDHTMLKQPCKIWEKDWINWTVERGRNFPTSWDENWQALLSMNDENQPAQKGGILFTKVELGSFAYTSLSLPRQLRAGVPGAYRLLSNLISYPRVKETLKVKKP